MIIWSRHWGVPYIGIAMPIAKDEERRAQFADFLCNIVEKYNIPITEADS